MVGGDRVAEHDQGAGTLDVVRINPDVRMNYLASPPLVVAYALAGTMDVDLLSDPLGADPDGRPVYLRDLWPTPHEVQDVIADTLHAEVHPHLRRRVHRRHRWRALDAPDTGPGFAVMSSR